MKLLTYDERVKRLNNFFQSGRIIRHEYTGEKDGKATACLLAAMSPEVGSAEDPSACPADVMPGWFAGLTPHIDDGGSIDAWHGMVERYAQLAGDWHRLSAVAWERLRSCAVRIALGELRIDAKALVGQVVGYWEDPNAMAPGQWRVLRARIARLTDANRKTDPSFEDIARAGHYKRVDEYRCRVHAWEAMIEIAKRPPRVDSIWYRTSKAAGTDNDSWEGATDRMTNLLFDAMQGEIDQAKAAN